MLPVSPALARVSRMAMPGLALALWFGLLTAGLVMLDFEDASVIGLGALAGVGMGAGTVRGAYRRAPNWAEAPVETPLGPIPSSQTRALVSGTDFTVVSMVPVLLALYLGHVPLLLWGAEAFVTLTCVLITAFSTRTGRDQ